MPFGYRRYLFFYYTDRTGFIVEFLRQYIYMAVVGVNMRRTGTHGGAYDAVSTSEFFLLFEYFIFSSLTLSLSLSLSLSQTHIVMHTHEFRFEGLSDHIFPSKLIDNLIILPKR